MKEIIITIISILLVSAATTPAFAQDEWFEVAEASAVTYGVPIAREIPIQEMGHRIHKRPLVQCAQPNVRLEAQPASESTRLVRERLTLITTSGQSDTREIVMMALPFYPGCQIKLGDE
jgi:hypothetical protein